MPDVAAFAFGLFGWAVLGYASFHIVRRSMRADHLPEAETDEPRV